MNLQIQSSLKITLLSVVLSACNASGGSDVEQDQKSDLNKKSVVTSENTMKNDATPSNDKVSVKVSKNSLPKEALDKLSWQEATVTYLNFEGGFYGLVTKDGEKLLPMNMKNDFRQHGAIVKVRGHIQKDILTTQQWGTPFKIAEIKLIKAGSKTNPADM